MTSRATWKARERILAHLFGTERTPLSGGASRHTRSDSLHPRLYLEAKLRSQMAIFREFAGVAEKARKEGKIPVLGLAHKGHRGFLIVCRDDDLQAIAEEYRGRKKNDSADE